MFIKIDQGYCRIEARNHYIGYGPVKTTHDREIYIKGAPRLYKPVQGNNTNEKVLEHNSSNHKTASLTRALLGEPDIRRWGDYLTGNFIIAVNDPSRFTCHVIVDFGNSFHLFWASDPKAASEVLAVGIEELARAVGKTDAIDYASIVDYLTNSAITYPYTFYKGIIEAPFATCLRFDYARHPFNVEKYEYWKPASASPEEALDMDGLARKLREGLLGTVDEILKDKDNVGLFLSGGADSRVLAGVINELGKKATTLTICDSHNRESEIAGHVARANGLTPKVLLRDLEYYPRLIEDSLKHEGPHFNFLRGSYLGFRDKICAYGFDALLGGYMSDSLLKIHEANIMGKCLFGRQLGPLDQFDRRDFKFLRGGSEYLKKFRGLIREEWLDQVAQRRRELLSYWEEVRSDGSAWEWGYIWPFMRNKHNMNLTTHLSFFQSYEIFTERTFLEIARTAAQEIKINGRLFNKAARPFLKRSAKIPLSVSKLPIYYPSWVNESVITVKHLLPRRFFFKDDTICDPVNPAATQRGFPDLHKIWEISDVLKKRRSDYDPGTLEDKIMVANKYGTFDDRRYGHLPQATRVNIMCMVMYLDIWMKGKSSARQNPSFSKIPEKTG